MRSCRARAAAATIALVGCSADSALVTSVAVVGVGDDVQGVRVAIVDSWVDDGLVATAPVLPPLGAVPAGAPALVAFVDGDGDGRLSAAAEASAPCYRKAGRWECHLQANRALVRTASRWDESSGRSTDVYLRGEAWAVRFCDGHDCVAPDGEPYGGYRAFRNCAGGSSIVFHRAERDDVNVPVEPGWRGSTRVVSSEEFRHAFTIMIEHAPAPTRVRAWLGDVDAEHQRIGVSFDGHRHINLTVDSSSLRACSNTDGCALWLQTSVRELLHSEEDLVVERSTETYGRIDPRAI